MLKLNIKYWVWKFIIDHVNGSVLINKVHLRTLSRAFSNIWRASSVNGICCHGDNIIHIIGYTVYHLCHIACDMTDVIFLVTSLVPFVCHITGIIFLVTSLVLFACDINWLWRHRCHNACDIIKVKMFVKSLKSQWLWHQWCCIACDITSYILTVTSLVS